MPKYYAKKTWKLIKGQNSSIEFTKWKSIKALFAGIPHDKASQIKLEDGTSSSTDFRSMASLFQTGIGTQARIKRFLLAIEN